MFFFEMLNKLVGLKGKKKNSKIVANFLWLIICRSYLPISVYMYILIPQMTKVSIIDKDVSFHKKYYVDHFNSQKISFISPKKPFPKAQSLQDLSFIL